MSTMNRKIGYYSIDFRLYRRGMNENHVFDSDYFEKVLDYICSLDTVDKLINREREKKSYFLDSCYKSENIMKIIFKSCKYGHCPPYISSESGVERETSKRQDEGEEEKTHLCIRIDNNEAVVILEERKSGVSINAITKYFNDMATNYSKSNDSKKKYSFNYSIIPGKDFLAAINTMVNLKAVDVYTYKRILGDEMLNYVSEEDPFIKDEVIVKLKSIPRENILKQTCKNIYNKIAGSGSEITRIRIYGKNDEGTSQILDSNFMKKRDSIDVQLASNGTVDTVSIFSKMLELF